MLKNYLGGTKQGRAALCLYVDEAESLRRGMDLLFCAHEAQRKRG